MNTGASNGSPSLNLRIRDAQALHRHCYLCGAFLTARVSIDYFDARARRMGRQLVCLECAVKLTVDGELWGRAITLTCEVCGHSFLRYYRVGQSRAAGLNGTRRELTVLCSDACRARRRRRQRPYPGAHCRRCGAAFVPSRADAQFCSVRCRVAAHRAAWVGMISRDG